ncbi:hypothetical protein O9992_25760 [Vibrio lentus]|nr:hypothetical protein [Vibrio lentus]
MLNQTRAHGRWYDIERTGVKVDVGAAPRTASAFLTPSLGKF